MATSDAMTIHIKVDAGQLLRMMKIAREGAEKLAVVLRETAERMEAEQERESE